MDQILDRLARKWWYYFLDGYSSYSKISIAKKDKYETMFTCPYYTFEVKHVPFGLCNTPANF